MTDGFVPTAGTLAAWDGWWIEARCRCRLAFLPCRMLARDHGPERRLAALVQRLRCKACGAPPASVVMIDDLRNPDGSPGPYPPARRVPAPQE